MADDKLLELIDVLNKQSQKVRVTDADEKELDPIIRRLDDSQIPDYQIAANIADAAKLVICINKKVNCADYSHKYAQKQNNKTTQDCYNPIIKSEVDGALQCSTQAVNNAKEIDTKIVSNSNKYLLKKIIEKAIENIAKSKKYVMGIKIGEEHKDTIDKIKSKLKAAEDILKGKVEELNKQFVDERTQEEKISESAESAEKVYNSYLLLYKLNELHVDELKDNDEKKSKLLQEVISEAIDSGKQEVNITINKENYKVEITKEGDSYKLKVSGEHTKPEVKDVLEYTAKDIIGLWAKSEVSIEKDQSNNFAFAVGLHDKSRLLDLTIGGLGKKVPFSLRFANFYKVIEILRDESKPLKERFRLANNIATGSGKTGDIALLKFWAYLANIPCITTVPSDTLRNQSNKFDKEFLPSEVAMEFGEPFSEGNTRYATTTFTEVLDKQWNLFNNTYGKDNGESALIMIDEAPILQKKLCYWRVAL